MIKSIPHPTHAIYAIRNSRSPKFESGRSHPTLVIVSALRAGPSQTASAARLRHRSTSPRHVLHKTHPPIKKRDLLQALLSRMSFRELSATCRTRREVVKIQHTSATSYVRRRLDQNLAVAAVSVLVWQEIHIFPMVLSNSRASLRGLAHDCGLLRTQISFS